MNTAVGEQTGDANTSGIENAFLGYAAGGANTTGSSNCFVGAYSGNVNTTAGNNTGCGHNTLRANTTGTQNTAVGDNALDSCTTGDGNTAVGYNAGTSLASNDGNTMIGYQAGMNCTGSQNTFLGWIPDGGVTTTGSTNTMIGAYAGSDITSGWGNVAVGVTSTNLTTGTQNAMVGRSAGQELTTGSKNVAIGNDSGGSLTTGDRNIFLGHEAGVSGSPGGAITTTDNKILMGPNEITHAYIQVDWSVGSDERDKTDIEDSTLGLNFVNQLEPKIFKWDKRTKYVSEEDRKTVDLDTVVHDGTHKEDWMDIGFMAQAVEVLEEAAGHKISDKTNLTTDLTDDGKQYSLIYAKFVPILTKAIQELSTENDALKARLTAGGL